MEKVAHSSSRCWAISIPPLMYYLAVQKDRSRGQLPAIGYKSIRLPGVCSKYVSRLARILDT